MWFLVSTSRRYSQTELYFLLFILTIESKKTLIVYERIDIYTLYREHFYNIINF